MTSGTTLVLEEISGSTYRFSDFGSDKYNVTLDAQSPTVELIVSKLKELEGLKNIEDFFIWNLNENRELNNDDLNPKSANKSETDRSFDSSAEGCSGPASASASAFAFGSTNQIEGGGSSEKRKSSELSC